MNRVCGAVMGALIGDALGLGCHWYYDLAQLRSNYGEWIDGYTTPKSGHYHEGMQAGQLSQTGLILVMLLESVIECGSYVEDDFTRRLEQELFVHLNGEARYGPGGYTNQSIREAYKRRVLQHKSWRETGGHADTTEAAERAIVLAARYAKQPAQVAQHVASNCRLTQSDASIVAMSTAYNVVLSRLIAGEKLTPDLSEMLMHLVQNGELPFHSVSQTPSLAVPDPSRQFPSPDALLTPHYVALAANDPGIVIEPAWKVSIVYGMPCAIYHQLPAAYYLASRFCDNFEAAVLHAINGGGQNMSRAMLTGALVGAQVGIEGIPERFIAGLENGQKLLALATRLSEQA